MVFEFDADDLARSLPEFERRILRSAIRTMAKKLLAKRRAARREARFAKFAARRKLATVL